MSDRSGIGLIEQLLLRTMLSMGARPDRPHVKSISIIEKLESDHGLHADYGYRAMCDLASEWLIPLRLVDIHGNHGSPDFGPASPRYTEARLTEAGRLAARCAQNDLPPLPFGLINGSMYAGGSAPPFHPADVLNALALANQAPELSDDDYAALVPAPSFPTGCSVAGDLAALRTGKPASLRLSCRATVETGPQGRSLSLTNLPFQVGGDEVRRALAGRATRRTDQHRYPELAEATALPFTNVADSSSSGGPRIVCELAEGADATAATEAALAVWPVSITRPGRLAAPLGALIRDGVATDRTGQLDAIDLLRAALQSP